MQQTFDEMGIELLKYGYRKVVFLEVECKIDGAIRLGVSPELPIGEQFECPECHAQRPCSGIRSEEHTSELQSHLNLVCRLLLEKKKKIQDQNDSGGSSSRNDGVSTRAHPALCATSATHTPAYTMIVGAATHSILPTLTRAFVRP